MASAGVMTGMEDQQAPAGNLALRPIGDKILVRQDPYNDRLGSGVLYRLKGQRDGYENFGTVEAIGSKANVEFKVGDRVFFKRKPASALSPDSREGTAWSELLRLTADDILAVIES